MIALVVRSASGDEARRVWSSESGKFKVEADFVGIEVVPSANIAFVCETEMGKSKSVSYGSVLQGARTISVTERTHSIRLMDGSKKIWEAGVPHDAPGTIVPPPGSTIEQELARLMNSSKNYFLSIRFPSKFVRYPDGQVSLGTSEVSLGLP